jgi:hypothetical protein
MKDAFITSRANPLWKETYAIVEYMYGSISELIINFPDEKWGTASKLRNAANDSLFYIAQAVGNATPEARDYDWSSARRNLFALETMYIFVCKQKFLELEPSIVVRIDTLLKQIDTQIEVTKKESKDKTQADLQSWLDKYQLWQKMNAQ